MKILHWSSQALTPIDTSYFGSGITIKHAIKKYGIENFKKEIISYHKTHEDAFQYEKELVTDELINTNECYNISAMIHVQTLDVMNA